MKTTLLIDDALKYDAVFISDVHLHPDMPNITAHFTRFMQWATQHTKSIYILGDFFHVWPGDDVMTDWIHRIADQLAGLAQRGISVYMMPGNRDFLMGHGFYQRAYVYPLPDPSVITLGGESILLTHGDRYCSRDRAHQWLRRLTRNRVFKAFFLALPYVLRQRIVNQVRQHSAENTTKSAYQMAVVEASVIKHLQSKRVHQVVHGHTHQPGLNKHHAEQTQYLRFVLSDWDETPSFLCYNEANGFQYILSEDCDVCA